MPADTDHFQCADTARLLTPDAEGAGLLWQGVAQTCSIYASPLAKVPLVCKAEPHQRVYCESSGSSGRPKLIRRSPGSWKASFEINRRLFDVGPDDSYAILGHMGHSLGLYGALEALHCGAGLALLGGIGAGAQASALVAQGVTVLYATPSQLQILLRSTVNWPDLRHVICGGGYLSQPVRSAIAARCPQARITEFFGASETSFMTLSDAATPAGSVGRAYPGVTLNVDDGGDIWVKSPYLFEGYETGDSPLTRWHEGALSIGELGWCDADGYLFLKGRRSRMVTVADQNIFPEAIEAVLATLPGVEVVAVITPVDPLRGHSIVAAIVGDASEAQIRKACRAQLSNAAVPRKVWRLTQMPLLSAGKPDLQALETRWNGMTL